MLGANCCLTFGASWSRFGLPLGLGFRVWGLGFIGLRGFYGLYLESYKVIPNGNYLGAYGFRVLPSKDLAIFCCWTGAVAGDLGFCALGRIEQGLRFKVYGLGFRV